MSLRYVRLGKVSAANFSKTWFNENGTKKTVFKFTVEIEGNPGDAPDVFGETTFYMDTQKQLLVFQEHMFTNFNVDPPSGAPHLTKHPDTHALIVTAFDKLKLNTNGNWLKKCLQTIAIPPNKMMMKSQTGVPPFREILLPQPPTEDFPVAAQAVPGQGTAMLLLMCLVPQLEALD
jgi:hypothetical protein